MIPRHGSLSKDRTYRYVPSTGYVGTDRVVFSVKGISPTAENPVEFKLIYFIKVRPAAQLDIYGDKPTLKPVCRETHWRISSGYLESEIASRNIQTALSAWRKVATLSALIASAQQTLTGFTDLPSTALGQTIGEGATAAITLDQNAAGHDWYIDRTPLDSSDDYLPTSNPEVWQAKAGSAAAGKMDMLSVLLHEYGHALGLEHSADARDFMATTLQPGERRLPSSEELQLMSQLVAQLKADSSAAPSDTDAPSSPTSPLPGMPLAGLGLFALGRLRSDRYGTQTLFAPNGSVLASVPQYDVAANATLTNGQFNAANNSNSNSTSTAPGWATEGSISIATGSATLVETATQ